MKIWSSKDSTLKDYTLKFNLLSAKRNKPEKSSQQLALRSISEEGRKNQNKAIGGLIVTKQSAEESFWTFVAKRQN